MKVMEVLTDANIGGAGILLVTRLARMDRRRFKTWVILPKESALKPRLERIGIKVLEISRGADCSADFWAIREYVRIFRKFQPDLVNCHGALSARLAARLCGVPQVVYTRHCAYPVPIWQKKFPGKWLIGNVQNGLADGVIAVAHAAKENLTDMGVSPRKIHVIVNGVAGFPPKGEEERSEIRRQLGIPLDSFVVGICARLETCKGHEDLLRSASRLLKTSSKYRFLIVGDGSRRTELEALAHRLGISDHVLFVGFAEDVSIYYHAMDLNVNCSTGTETACLALSEGMSLGIPAVASDYGGNPYMIRDGENGLLYPVGCDDLLAEKIKRMAEDPALYRRLSQGAYRRFLIELNAERMTKETEHLYEMLGQREKGHSPRSRVAKPK